jgi:hypothetical protein
MAKNRGVMDRLMKKIGIERMQTQWDTQIAGAVGAALFAYAMCLKGGRRKAEGGIRKAEFGRRNSEGRRGKGEGGRMTRGFPVSLILSIFPPSPFRLPTFLGYSA